MTEQNEATLVIAVRLEPSSAGVTASSNFRDRLELSDYIQFNSALFRI